MVGDLTGDGDLDEAFLAPDVSPPSGDTATATADNAAGAGGCKATANIYNSQTTEMRKKQRDHTTESKGEIVVCLSTNLNINQHHTKSGR